MVSWIDFRTEPVTNSPHSVVVIGTRIECDYISCNYSEEFDDYDDALTAKEIHEEQEEY